MGVDEKILVGRWFVGAIAMPEEVRDSIVENKQIPDGLTDGELLANDLKTQYEAHRVDVSSHNSADSTNTVSAADATTEASLITLANELKADFNAHIADATVHNSADAVDVITLADATDLVSADKLLNALKTAYTAHIANGAVHDAPDTTNLVTALFAQPWYQVWMGEPGGKYEITREFVDSKRQLFGTVRTQYKNMTLKVTMPIATSKFSYLRDYAKLDPEAGDTDDVMVLKDNFGMTLAGMPVLAYPYDGDPSNDSNIPDPTTSDEVFVMWEGVNKGNIIKDFNGEQGLLGMELEGMSDTLGTAGKALKTKGLIGSFEKVS